MSLVQRGRDFGRNSGIVQNQLNIGVQALSACHFYDFGEQEGPVPAVELDFAVAAVCKGFPLEDGGEGGFGFFLQEFEELPEAADVPGDIAGVPEAEVALRHMGEVGFDVVGLFEHGQSQSPPESRYAPGPGMSEALATSSAQWFDNPADRFKDETSRLTEWLFRDTPESLFVLPIRETGKNIGVFHYLQKPLNT